jgi:hypothetical protein
MFWVIAAKFEYGLFGHFMHLKMSIADYAEECYCAECLQSEDFSLTYDPETNKLVFDPPDVTFSNLDMSDSYNKEEVDNAVTKSPFLHRTNDTLTVPICDFETTATAAENGNTTLTLWINGTPKWATAYPDDNIRCISYAFADFKRSKLTDAPLGTYYSTLIKQSDGTVLWSNPTFTKGTAWEDTYILQSKPAISFTGTIPEEYSGAKKEMPHSTDENETVFGMSINSQVRNRLCQLFKIDPTLSVSIWLTLYGRLQFQDWFEDFYDDKGNYDPTCGVRVEAPARDDDGFECAWLIFEDNEAGNRHMADMPDIFEMMIKDVDFVFKWYKSPPVGHSHEIINCMVNYTKLSTDFKSFEPYKMLLVGDLSLQWLPAPFEIGL